MTAPIGTERAEALATRLFTQLTGGFELLSVHLGVELGLYRALADLGGTSTSGDLAERAGVHPRYAQEWCEQQAAAGYLDLRHGDGGPRFVLPAEHYEVLLDPVSALHAAPAATAFAGIAGVLSPLLEAYRTGGGVPYAAFGRELRHGIGAMNRPMFVHDLAGSWLPAMPDVHAALLAGAQVLDVGCGTGASSIALATSYPQATVHGIDLDAASIADSVAGADAAGLGDRIGFEVRDAAELTGEPRYDLITMFETLHDMGDPVGALRAARAVLRPDGSIFVADEHTEEALRSPAGDVERMLYGWSVLHCLPATMAENPRVAAGTVLRAQTVRAFADEAGLSVEVLPIDNDFWRFYRLRPATTPDRP